jgi:threonine dehydrogenase-like Zn-dependent dehydrogenase
MKARSVRYTPDGDIELVEMEVADPGSHEVQVEAAVCGICSWDIATCRQGREMPAPAPPGHEGVGYVRAVGSDVAGLREGDRVAGGGFQTIANLKAASLHKLPDAPAEDERWVVEPVSCCVTALDTSPLKAGDRVAVVGCGFMGLILVQLLARSCVSELVALDLVAARLELARQFGASETYNLSAVDNEELISSLKTRGIDVVYDTSGAQGGLDLSTRIVRPAGHVNLFGWIKGTQATIDPTLWHMKGFNLVSSSPTARVRDTFPPAIRLVEKGIVDLGPLVTHVVGLDEYPALMKRILAGDPGYIKGVVRLGTSNI